MKNLLFFLLLSSPLAFSEPERQSSFSLSEITGMLGGEAPGPKVDCFDPKETPACNAITDSFCTDLGLNGGNATDPTGTISVGMSKKSQLSEMERSNLVDITRAFPRLPADLQREIQRPVQKLTQLIGQENDSKNWYRDVSRVRNEIAEKIKDVAERRANVTIRSRMPQGQRPTDADKKAEQDAQHRALMETFTQAKVDSSPNWARIQSVYQKVKQDMLAVLETLPLTAEEKQQRIAKINSTNLSYPFGIRVGGVIGQIMESDCRTNMINAMYMPFTGTLTVCAGFLNGYQSENAVYFTLAHELAHSFNLKQIQTQNSVPRWSTLNNRLLETNGNMPCEEYNRRKVEGRTEPDNYQCGRNEYNNFMNCLNGNRPPASPFTQSIRPLMDKVGYCDILDRRQGLAYMNPTEFADRRFATLVSSTMQEYTGTAIPTARGMLSPAYFVAQEARCNPQTSCETVLSQYEIRALYGTTPPACTVNSERGAENESDWYAHKAMILKLRGTTDIRARRQLVAGSLALFCPFSYSRPHSDKDQAKLEKELENLAQQGGTGEDHHASSEERISAAMTEEVASLLQCTRPTETPVPVQSYQSCKI